MPAAFNEIGVKCVTAALVESVDVQKQIEHKILKKSERIRDGQPLRPVIQFQRQGPWRSR